MRLALIIILTLSLTTVAACGKSPTVSETATSPSPTPIPESPAARVARLEDEFQNADDDDNKMRAEVREAVTEYVKNKLPRWTIKGLSTQPYQGNIFWVDVDLKNDNQVAVVSLSARKFFSDSGDSYWRVTLLDKALGDRLRDLDDTNLLKELNAAKSER
jgi:hypothetical protein